MDSRTRVDQGPAWTKDREIFEDQAWFKSRLGSRTRQDSRNVPLKTVISPALSHPRWQFCAV